MSLLMERREQMSKPKSLTSKEIATIHKTNEVHSFLMDVWEKVFRYEMDSDQCGTIPAAMCELRKAIDEAQDYVLINAKGIKIN